MTFRHRMDDSEDFHISLTLPNAVKLVVCNINCVKLSLLGHIKRKTKITLLNRIIEINAGIRNIEKACGTSIQNGVNITIFIGADQNMNGTVSVAENLRDIIENSLMKNVPHISTNHAKEQVRKLTSKRSGIFAKCVVCLNIIVGKTHNIMNFKYQRNCYSPEKLTNKQKTYIRQRRKAMDLEHKVIGKTRVVLQGKEVCYEKECNTGNLVTDAFISYITNTQPTSYWTASPIAFINGGHLEETVDVRDRSGNISRSDLIRLFPYDDTIVTFCLTGEDLRAAFEHSVSDVRFFQHSIGKFLQVSGVHVLYDKRLREGERVRQIKVRCRKCSIPHYEAVDPRRIYNVVSTSFLSKGGDGYDILLDKGTNKVDTSYDVVVAVAEYITAYSPIHPEVEHRIRFNGTDCSGTIQIRKILYVWSLIILYHSH